MAWHGMARHGMANIYIGHAMDFQLILLKCILPGLKGIFWSYILVKDLQFILAEWILPGSGVIYWPRISSWYCLIVSYCTWVRSYLGRCRFTTWFHLATTRLIIIRDNFNFGEEAIPMISEVFFTREGIGHIFIISREVLILTLSLPCRDVFLDTSLGMN